MSSEIKQWFLMKHYAKRIPPISYLFGLYDKKNIIQGVCSFGMCVSYQEMLGWRPFNLIELNRLIVNEGLPNNTLSYFVSQSLKKLPSPIVIISYADIEQGHHGYIYQATNWLYTGLGSVGTYSYIIGNGKSSHSRHIKEYVNRGGVVKEKVKNKGKARYYYFIGSKKEQREMKQKLRYPILPYIKGDNKKYDASYKPDVQQILF